MPVGNPPFLNWVNYTPTFTGFSSDPTSVVARYALAGRLVIVNVRAMGGTSNATSFGVSAPFTAATVTNAYWGACPWVAQDNSALFAGSNVYIASASTAFALDKTPAGGAWTNVNLKGASFEIIYEI